MALLKKRKLLSYPLDQGLFLPCNYVAREDRQENSRPNNVIINKKKLLNTHPLSAAITAAPMVGIFGLFYSGICECCSLQSFDKICETSHGWTDIHKSLNVLIES